MIFRKIINETHHCMRCGKTLAEDEVAACIFLTSSNIKSKKCACMDDITYELCEECKDSFRRFVHEKTINYDIFKGE